MQDAAKTDDNQGDHNFSVFLGNPRIEFLNE